MVNKLKIVSIILLTALLTSACSVEEKSNQQVELVDAIINTNEMIMINKQNTVVKVNTEFTSSLSYNGSGASINFESDFHENYFTYTANASAQTFVSLVENVINKDLEGTLFLPTVTYSETTKLPEIDKFDGEILNLNTKALEPFYKANKLYFSTEENVNDLDAKLNKYVVDKTLNPDEQGPNPTYKLVAPLSDVSQAIPFINLNEFFSIGGKVTLYLELSTTKDNSTYIKNIRIPLYEHSSEDDKNIQFSGSFNILIDLFADDSNLVGVE